jgi:hypothetical protein
VVASLTVYEILIRLLELEADEAKELQEILGRLGNLDLAAQFESIDAQLAGLSAQLAANASALAAVLALLTPPAPPAALILVGGDMGLTVDSTNQKMYLVFEDDKGEPVDAPSGATATFTPDNLAVLTEIVTEPSQAAVPTGFTGAGKMAIVGDITIGVEGTVNVSAHATNADGTEILGPDDATPIPDPPALALTVNPGAPAAEVLQEG